MFVKWLLVFGIFVVYSVKAEPLVRDTNSEFETCVYKNKTYRIGEYALPNLCKVCRCRKTAEGVKMICTKTALCSNKSNRNRRSLKTTLPYTTTTAAYSHGDTFCFLMSPCRNGGTCHNVPYGEGFVCQCTYGMTGKHCETRLSSLWETTIPTTMVTMDTYCFLISPCHNGGTCRDINGGSSYACICPSGFGGKNCESKVSSLWETTVPTTPPSSSNTCVYNGRTYGVGASPFVGNCKTCTCVRAGHVECYNVCIGKRETLKGRKTLKSLFHRFRRYETPPPFTTVSMTTTPSPPPFTTKIPPSPPTTDGPGRPHFLDSGHVTHHKTQSPPPPDVYNLGLG